VKRSREEILKEVKGRALDFKRFVLEADNIPPHVKEEFEQWDPIEGKVEKTYYYKQCDPGDFYQDCYIMLDLCMFNSKTIPQGSNVYIKWFDNSHSEDYDIKKPYELGGLYQRDKNFIWVNVNLSLENQLKTVAHEFRHMEQNEEYGLLKIGGKLYETEARIYQDSMLECYKQYLHEVQYLNYVSGGKIGLM